MALTDKQVEHVVDSVAIRFGITGFVSAHRPANRDNLLVIQLRGHPSCEFEMESNASEDDIRRKAEEIFERSEKAN